MQALVLYMSVAAVLLIAGACSSKVSSWLNLPVLLLFLGVGMVAGSEGIGGIDFTNAPLANAIGTVAMAYILFAGGYDTSWKSVKPVLVYGSILSSLGVLLTAVVVGIFAAVLLGKSWQWGLLLGSIVSSTDAAAVFAILRSRKVSLKGKLQPLLEFESGSNDPMAAFLTIFMIGVLQAPETASYWLILPSFLLKMGVGIAGGAFWGWAMGKVFNKIDFEYDGLYYVMGIATVLLAFGSSELIQGNGFMAVYVCGLVMGNTKFIYQHGLRRFHDGIGWLMQVLLFGTLGLLVFPSQLLSNAVNGFAIALFLMLIARPLVAFVCMIGSSFTYRERLFVSWVGLRGGAPIMLATFPMLYQTEDYNLMFNLVFFLVLTSVLVQGKTLMPLARFLGLDKPLKVKPRVPLEFENTGTINGETEEFEILPGAPYIGKKIAELGLPKGALVLLIRRGREFVVPHGNTVLKEHDGLMILAEPAILSATEAHLATDGASAE